MEKIKDGRFLQLFGDDKPKEWNQRVFLPVVHVTNDMFPSAMKGVMTAYEAGADGVLLIDMHAGTGQNYLSLRDTTGNVCRELKKRDIEFLIGVNFLDIFDVGNGLQTAALAGAAFHWTDYSGGRGEIEMIRDTLKNDDIECRHRNCLHLGPVAFKYQQPVLNTQLQQVAQEATWMDVCVTSGPGTGKEIDLIKAKLFANAIPNHPKGVASGVSAANIQSLLPFFNVFIVATSICDDDDALNLTKTKELASIIHSWVPSD